MKSNESIKDLVYYIQIEEWSDQRIRMIITFSNPLAISLGKENDIMKIRIKKEAKMLFISAKSLE